jgi:hypothetical protein
MNKLTQEQLMINAHKAGRSAASRLSLEQVKVVAAGLSTPQEQEAFYAGYHGERNRNLRQSTR